MHTQMWLNGPFRSEIYCIKSYYILDHFSKSEKMKKDDRGSTFVFTCACTSEPMWLFSRIRLCLFALVTSDLIKAQ